MKKNTNKTPKLRFPQFNDAWEQRKLETISDVRDGTHNSPQYVQDGHPFITSKNVANGFINYDDIQYVSDIDYEEINKRSKVDIHDILMGMIGTIGNLALIREKPDFAIKNVALIKHTGIVNYMFLYQILQSSYVTNQLLSGMDGGTQKFIALNKIRGLDIPVPTEEEQRMIGVYFENLDRLITLHQRKLDTIKELKKGMLQKVFPKKGEKVPEVRFSQFTDDWKQRKFSDGVSEIGDGLHGTPMYCESGNVFFVNGNNFVDGKIVITPETKTVDNLQQSAADKALDSNTILMSINGTIGNLAYYSGENLMLGKSAAYIKVSKYDKKFVYAYLQSSAVLNYFMNNLTGTTIKNLGLRTIREMKLSLPLDIVEQKRIGMYFEHLDNLITLHQRKLDAYKELKKGLLQQMFV